MKFTLSSIAVLVGVLICLVPVVGCQPSIRAQEPPLERMTDEQIADLSTLRDPDSVEELKHRVLRLAPGYGVQNAKVVEVRRTTLGEVRNLVNIPIEDPGAPVWHIILSGTVEDRGPPIETPRGFGQAVYPGLQIVWEAKEGGRPLGSQLYGSMLVRLQDGSVLPYATSVPMEVPTPTPPPPGGPSMPVEPAGGSSGTATPTPTATPSPQ